MEGILLKMITHKDIKRYFNICFAFTLKDTRVSLSPTFGELSPVTPIRLDKELKLIFDLVTESMRSNILQLFLGRKSRDATTYLPDHINVHRAMTGSNTYF